MNWVQIIIAFIAGGFLMPVILSKIAGNKTAAA